jgi:hypothetical protein
MLYYSTVQRPVWFRALIAIWGFWFTAALIEAPGIHACAVHSSGGAHGHVHSAPAAPMQMGSHGERHDAASPDAPGDRSSTCTCLGLCCFAPHFVGERSTSLAVPATIATVLAAAPIDTAPAVSRPHARPFANGPPAAI